MFKVELIGNIGADARVQNANGNEFVSFNVAADKHSDKEDTIWVSVTTPAVKLAKYLLKGTKVYLRGNANTRTYKDQQNITRVGINLFANEIEFCGGAKHDNNSETATPNQKENNGEGAEGNDDMPF